MIIELSLIFTFSIQFRHLLQAIEHALYDAIVCCIDAASDLQTIRTNKLAFNARDIHGEIFDKVRYASPFLCIEPRLFNAFDLLVLPNISVRGDVIDEKLQLTTWRSKIRRRRWCCLSRTPAKKAFPRDSASATARSIEARTPTICL